MIKDSTVKEIGMFKLNSDSKIYIITPTTYFNGGAELLHQLCDVMRRNNYNAHMCYYNKAKGNYEKISIPRHLEIYDLKTAEEIEDCEQNLLIVPETITQPLREFNKIQKCVWWLAMGNYFWKSELYKFNPTAVVVYHWVRYFIGKKTPMTLNELKRMNIQHLSQCWYGVAFLQRKGLHNVAYLSDYINTLHEGIRNNSSIRKDIILYNPKRNTKYIENIKKKDRSLNFIPVQNMTLQQVGELMKTSKLYVDFGSHPGKDRMPREAALHGCCILTSTLGSADFWDDVPIDSEFKFVRTKQNIDNVIKKIHDILDNYSSYTSRFDGYREYIYTEKDKFEQDVLKIFQHNFF